MWLDFGNFWKRNTSGTFWLVLSRLSLGIYLTFPVVGRLFNSSRGVEYFTTDYNFDSCRVALLLSMSFLSGLLAFIFFEAPVSYLMKGSKTHEKRILPEEGNHKMFRTNLINTETTVETGESSKGA